MPPECSRPRASPVPLPRPPPALAARRQRARQRRRPAGPRSLVDGLVDGLGDGLGDGIGDGSVATTGALGAPAGGASGCVGDDPIPLKRSATRSRQALTCSELRCVQNAAGVRKRTNASSTTAARRPRRDRPDALVAHGRSFGIDPDIHVLRRRIVATVPDDGNRCGLRFRNDRRRLVRRNDERRRSSIRRGPVRLVGRRNRRLLRWPAGAREHEVAPQRGQHVVGVRHDPVGRHRGGERFVRDRCQRCAAFQARGG